ncbi:MAG: hypothetical protein OES13_03575, partial [Acidimicrobiia bacterium]|nr:hypothetical protein [Acidimicrobiia bacterium]
MGNISASRRLAALVAAIALLAASCSSTTRDDCERTPPEGKSMARLWNERILEAIRRDFPAPTVHSRNLFHLSAAMWD